MKDNNIEITREIHTDIPQSMSLPTNKGEISTIKHEDPHDLNEKIHNLELELEEEQEKLEAVTISQKAYGDPSLKAFIGDTEITPELIAHGKENLALLKAQKKELHKDFSLRKELKKIRHLFWML